MKKIFSRIDIFAPITRVFEENGVVIAEGYAFVNEVVPGEGGIRLKRSTMVDATPDYLRHGTGALRVMHQAIAAGVVPSVTWDEKGAFIRAEVVDENEKQKTLAGVYKGFSVGVLPTMMRGLDVEKCMWPEISLVDRPKDAEATLTVCRVDGIGSATSIEIEVDDLDDGTSTLVSVSLDTAPLRDFASAMSVDAATDLVYNEGYDAMWTLWDVLYDIAASGVDNREELAQASIAQFADYVAPMVAGNTMPPKAERVALPKEWDADAIGLFRSSFEQAIAAGGGRPFTLAGLERAETVPPEETTPPADQPSAVEQAPDNAALTLTRFEATINGMSDRLNRLDEIHAAVARIDGLSETVQANASQFEGLVQRLTRLENQPVALTAPVRFPADYRPSERQFTANDTTDTTAVERGEIQAQIERLVTELPDEPDEKKRHAGVTQLNRLKVRLSQLSN